MSPSTSSRQYRDLIIHVLCWSIMLFFPLLLSVSGSDDRSVNVWRSLRGLGGPVASMLLFYINYLLLIPRLYFGRRKRLFFLVNVGAIALALCFVHEWWTAVSSLMPAEGHPAKFHPPRYPIYFYNAVQFVLIAGLSVAVRMGQRWQRMEQERTEALQSRTDAELRNLRNQLNPHFLLNTLNNIYALIAFDSEKAQQAVSELSRLLRHVLYECRQDYVPLCKEVDFLRNYIELMRIRVNAGVQITVDIDVAADDATPVAPLLFISLVENAFKHGISPTGDGHISVAVASHDGTITCRIVNSNHPKRQNDKSGSGIGLEQVARRLQLLYPGKHVWEKGTRLNGTEYYSHLTLQPL